MNITIRNNQLKKLAEAVEKAGRSLPQELATACNKTAKGMQTPISKEIRKVLAVKAGDVKKVVRQSRTASKNDIESAVAVDRTQRLPLRDFGARQTKAGVTYRISKQTGRKTAKGAFIVNKLGRHVFKRKTKSRLPITKLFGASPWAVFIKNNMDKPVSDEAEQRLEKEINRRIQYNVFKASEL